MKTTKALRLVAGLLAGAILGTARGDAHKPITSKYTYTEHVFPIFRDRCGACHLPNGAAPMSLLTYKDAVPWAESIRTELMAARMPPWDAEDGFGAFSNAHPLSARELDTILVWATGGTPPGDPAKMPAAPIVNNGWMLGAPDLALPMPSSFTLAADLAEATREFVLQPATAETRWIKAVDLLPGTAAIVRDAAVVVKGAPDEVLALWEPGERAVPAPEGTAFRLPARAELVLRIHYKKTWRDEGRAVTDRSTVGIYFAHGTKHDRIRQLVLKPGRNPIGLDVLVMAVRVETNRPGVLVQAEAVRGPDNSRVPMIRLKTRPDWPRRYWLERPISLPVYSRIEVTQTSDRGAPTTGAAPIRVTLDVVSRLAPRPSGVEGRQRREQIAIRPLQ